MRLKLGNPKIGSGPCPAEGVWSTALGSFCLRDWGQLQEWATQTIPSQLGPQGWWRQLPCSLELMAQLLQSEQRRDTEEDSPQSKAGFQLPSGAMGESLELGPLFPLLLGASHFQETQVEGPAAGQVPTGAINTFT